METTRLIARLGAASLLLAAFPTVAQQDEGRVFFSVSSDRTYGPADTPQIQMWGQGVNKLDFRLYRVNDPVQFFRNLKDDHRFGGRMAQSKKLSRIERFRRWKLAQRERATALMRAQFTRESRQQIRSNYLGKVEAPAPKTPKVTEYAELPVLNQQQLVSSWTQPFNPKNRWESLTVPIPVKGKGLYLVEAASGPLFAYTIVSVTDIAIIAKASPGRLLARVVDRKSGAPVAQAPVLVYANDKETKYADGKTTADGFVEAKVSEDRPESALVLARVKDDFAAVSLYGGNLGQNGEDNLFAYVYTDRPIYRPGHRVHYRAVLRQRGPSGYRIPSDSVSVTVEDSEGKSVHQGAPKISRFGSIEGEFDLPGNASLGNYMIQVRAGEMFQSGNFKVEEYKKPEYDVRVTPKLKRVLQGNEIQAEIEAKYFYGEPVAGASVKYVVHRSRHWSWFYADDEDEDSVPDDSPYAQREQVLEREGKLDENGKLTVSIPTDRAEFDLSYRIEARVTEAAGRETSGAGFAVATVGPFRIDIRPEKYVYEPGAMATFRIEARDYDGNPVPNAKVNVDLGLYSWQRREQDVSESGQAVTGPDGRASVQLRVTSGSLRAAAKVRTADGRSITDFCYLWVSGGSSWWGGADSKEIKLVADKRSYKPGETARILVAASPGMSLWITAEGAAVHSSRFVTAKESTVTVDIPVSNAYAPNFFVEAVAMKDHELWTGSLLVKVPPAEHKLDVEITPSKKEFKPGEPAAYSILAKDWKGNPVQAEFSVGVVDEAVYSVEPDTTKDPVSFFYGREWNRVTTESSLHYSFHGEAGRRRMQLARVRPFPARAQLKPERLVQPKIRKVFPDTAFWSATVKTDSGGRAQVKLDFPDSLTTWRATARGVTADTKLGAAINRVIVRKNLLTRLAVPRFFRQGDEMTIGVIAQNYLASGKRVKISLDAKGLEIVQGGTQDVLVPSRGTATVDFRVKVPAGREAVVLAKALSDEESDAVELTLPVIPYGVKTGIAKSGAMTSNGEDSAEIVFPDDADAATRTIEVSASPTVAGTMFDALDYLTSFPYGCTEQTMSSFLPNVIVSQATKSLQLKTRIDEGSLAKKIEAGLQRLYDFQHDDGGWGWWKEDDSDYFMTSYVVAGLSQARDAGTPVEQERIRNAVRWLASHRKESTSVDRQAYAAYASALAGQPDKALLDSLYRKQDELNASALATLGLALDRAKDTRAATIAENVEKAAKTNEAEAWWPVDRDYCLDIFEDASPEATAFAVKLLSRQRPDSPLLPKAAFWLVNHRRGGFYWNSTKQTALVIHGLTDYLKVSGELKPNVAFLVYVNDRQVLSRKFTAEDPLAPATVRLTGNELQAGKNKVRIVRSGAGRVYWSASANYYATSGKAAPAGKMDLSIDRQYFRMVPGNSGGKIVYDLHPFDGNAAQGDLIAVKLNVKGNEGRYLLVEDPIPAGTEIVPRDDLYEFRQKPEWWTYWFTRREYRDDRAAFFHSYLRTGSTTDYYLLKVVNPGKFRVSPARVEPMYQPQFFATSDGASWEVKK